MMANSKKKIMEWKFKKELLTRLGYAISASILSSRSTTSTSIFDRCI
jgi:hypothetical protein